MTLQQPSTRANAHPPSHPPPPTAPPAPVEDESADPVGDGWSDAELARRIAPQPPHARPAPDPLPPTPDDGKRP